MGGNLQLVQMEVYQQEGKAEKEVDVQEVTECVVMAPAYPVIVEGLSVIRLHSANQWTRSHSLDLFGLFWRIC